MLSGKTPGSELGKQRQTHDRESQGGWMRGNHCLPGSVATRPAKGNPPCDPQTPAHTTLHFNDPGNERFSFKLSLIKFKIPDRFR